MGAAFFVGGDGGSRRGEMFRKIYRKAAEVAKGRREEEF
jgi:hypothetical protein